MDFDTLLQSPNLRAFLRVIRAGETSQTDDAYRTIFGGGTFTAPPWEHPNLPITVGKLTSTAAGAYQFLYRTWNVLRATYKFGDFSPGNQDRGAIALIAGRGALQDVLNGNFQDAVKKCAREWASLPGSPYGQPTRTFAQAMDTYASYGGEISQETA